MNIKHTASVIRATKRRLYEAKMSYTGKESYVSSYEEFIKTENLWSGELESPVLKEDEEIYVASIEEVVQIKKAVRSTDNSYIYYAYDKRIDDELSTASKTKAEEDKVKIDLDIRDVENLKNATQKEDVADKYAKALEKINLAISELQSELKQD